MQTTPQEYQNDKAEEPLMPRRQHSRLAPISNQGGLHKLRWWLNLVFIIAAMAGMALWFTQMRDVATYLLIAAVGLKFIEATLRILKL